MHQCKEKEFQHLWYYGKCWCKKLHWVSGVTMRWLLSSKYVWGIEDKSLQSWILLSLWIQKTFPEQKVTCNFFPYTASCLVSFRLAISTPHLDSSHITSDVLSLLRSWHSLWASFQVPWLSAYLLCRKYFCIYFCNTKSTTLCGVMLSLA